MNNIDKDVFHDALEEVVLNIREDTKQEIDRIESKLDKLIDILEKLV